MHWYCYNNAVPLLNEVKTLTFRSVVNFKTFGIYLDLSDSLPACQPAIRPTSAGCTAPEISHNKGNRRGFTFRLRFVHCTMVIPFILHYSSFFYIPLNKVRNSQKKVSISCYGFCLLRHTKPWLAHMI